MQQETVKKFPSIKTMLKNFYIFFTPKRSKSWDSQHRRSRAQPFSAGTTEASAQYLLPKIAKDILIWREDFKYSQKTVYMKGNFQLSLETQGVLSTPYQAKICKYL